MRSLVAIIAVAVSIARPALAQTGHVTKHHVSPHIYGSADVPTARAPRSSWNGYDGMAAANGAAAMHEEDIDSRYGGHGG